MPNSNVVDMFGAHGLPKLQCLEDLASATNLSSGMIKSLAFRSAYFYKTYTIPKSDGTSRLISQPSRALKALQGWILRNILDKMQSSEHSKGFEKNESILNNAKPHVGCVCVLNIDLKDFFPSVKASRVYGIFSSIGYNRELCVLLTNLCVFKGSLPQGAPTSPKLANLVCSKLDRRIGGYAGSRGLVYTRYADDITLSAPTIKKVKKAKQFLGTIVASESLVINKRKTRVIGTRKQKSITGLILSENRVGIGRARFREIRAKLHSLFVERSSEFNKVNGLLAFTYGVDKPSYRKLLKYIEKLCEKYPASKAVTEIHKIKFSEEKSSTPK